MPTLFLGNASPLDTDGPTVVRMHIPDTASHSEAMRDIVHDDGHWARQGRLSPAWVASADGPQLAAAVSAYYDCPVIEADDASVDYHAVVAGGTPDVTFPPATDQEN